MKIILLKSSRVFLLKHNQIPLAKFLNMKYINEFRKLFDFNEVAPQQDVSSGEIVVMMFVNGLFKSKDGKEIAVARLGVESRKIVCDIIGGSAYFDEIYQVVKEFLAGLETEAEEGYLTPLVEANESEIISHLEISPVKLFPAAFVEKIIPEGLSIASYEFAKARLSTLQSVFQVDYENTNSTILSDGRINLVRKDFLIQTAIGRSLEEQIFASKAPLTSDNHIKYLENLEKTLNN